MQLNHYVWLDNVHLSGMFMTRVGDELLQLGPEQYAYIHTPTGERFNLSLNDFGMEDMVKRGYLKLVETIGEPVQRFEDIVPLVIHADALDSAPNLTAPVKDVEPAEPEEVDPEVEAIFGEAVPAATEAEEAEVVAKTVKKVTRAKKGK
jgi:hypothetical protein